METRTELFFGRPFYGRLPEFRGAAFAVNRLTSMQEFETAKVIKVEMSQRDFGMRKLILDLGRSVAWTQAGSEAFYRVVSKAEIPFHYNTQDAAGREAAEVLSKQISLKDPVKIDIIVLPSLAVDPQTGARVNLGQGVDGGFSSDLEFGILTEIGAITKATKCVTLVHPYQLEEFDAQEMEPFDVPVDVILTPTKTYYTETQMPRPKGIYWDLLHEAHFREVAVLNRLKSIQEKQRKQRTPRKKSRQKLKS